MKKKEDIAYRQFKAALDYFAAKKGRGYQKKLVFDTKLSNGYVSQVCNGERTPSLDAQERIALACGYDDLASFLKFGKNLLACESKPGMKKLPSFTGAPWKTTDAPSGDDDIEKNSGIDPIETPKVGDAELSSDKESQLIGHYSKMVDRLEKENERLLADNNKLREELESLRQKEKPSEDKEKKTAV